MTWRPLPGDRPARTPPSLQPSLDRIASSLGAPPVDVLRAIFGQWEEIVGPAVAAHARPLSLRRGTLVIGVDQPAWVTELTYLEADLTRRIEAVAGTGAVRQIRVTVRPK